MGETGETPANPSVDEQNPEEEGETEESSGDTETPVTGENNTGEEVGENEAETPVETPEETPTETPVEPDFDASIMGVEDIRPMAFGLTNIEVRNGENGAYTITLPDTIEETAADFVVTVAPGTGKTVTAVKYKDKNVESDSDSAVKSATRASGENQWTISLTDAESTFPNGMVIFAETEAKTYKVTIEGYNLQGISTQINYGLDDAEVTTPCSSGEITVPHGSVLKLQVPLEARYEATVKVGNTPITPDADDIYVIGPITAETTVTVEVTKTSYEVKSTVVAATGETIDSAVLNAVQVVWGAEVTASDEEPKKYTVPKDTNLTFTIEGLDDLKAAVFYGNNSAQATPVELKNGKYTISKDDVETNDGVTVKVEVRNVGKSAITMAANTDVKSLTYKNAEGAYVAIGSGAEVKEDQTFEFKVEANEFFKVTDVTAKTASNKEVAVEETVEGKDTVYSFTATNENIEITVATELDKTQCYQLEMNVVGDEGSVTAAVTVADGETEADTPALNATLPADDPVITRNAKVKAVLTVDTHYELAKTDPVKLGTTTLTAETAGTYVLELTRGELATLTVTTERKGLEAVNTVTFDGSAASHMTLDVEEVPEKVTLDADVENKYNLAVGVKDIDFSITADGPYTPTVMYSTNKEVKPVGVPEKKDGKTVYTYSLAAVLLGANDTIVITETESRKTLTVLYEENDVDVTIKKGTQSATITDVDGGVTVEVTEGDSLTITAAARDNCKLDAITEKVGDGDAAPLKEFTKGSLFHKFNVTAEDDITISITAEKLLSVQPLKDVDNSTTLTLNKSKKYDVRYDGTYEAAVKSGTALLVLQKVELKKGTEPVPQTTEEGGENWSTTFKAGDTSAQITLAEGLAGAECTLLLYDSAEEGAQPVASYALKVSSLLADKDVRINGGKEIKQAADTTVSYKVDVTKNADIAELKFEVPTGEANKDVVKTAAIVNGMLQITTGYGAGESTELKVYTGPDNAKKYIQKDGKDLTVKVTASALLEETKFQPTVKQASSTDVSLTLSLGAKGVAAPANGKVYYEVKLTPNYVAAEHNDKLLETVPVQYIEKTGDAQEASIYVGAKGNADQPQYGTGAACQYGIAVRLVHSGNAAVNGTELAAPNLKSWGKTFTKDAAKDFSTKTPAYETKLTLKKGVTTVYTGQTVIAATPQFSKETTYMVIPDDGASDISMGMQEDELLDVEIRNNKLVVSADDDTKLGKHTVQVMAATTAGDTMYASRATIVITVVRGIEEISLNVPTDSIYYADKAVTLKTTVDYNGSRHDANPKDSVPKAKKAEYRLVDTSVTTSSLSTLEGINSAAEAAVVKDGVKIDKSGKISVPKNYKVTADSKFKVLVKADDFKENTAYDLSGTITITRDYMQIAKAIIVKHNSDRQVYEVIDAQGKELNASLLDGAQLIACVEGLPNKDAYDVSSRADSLDTYWITKNLTYTSSNKKAVEIDSDGVIKVNAPAKNVKLSVAPADGSAADKKLNTTKVITTTIKYDDVEELGLEIEKYNLASEDNTPEKTFKVEEVEKGPVTEIREISYNDSSAATFELTLHHKVDASWERATLFTDYKLSVKKGKLLDVNKEGAIRALIAANDKLTTVELTYKVYNAEKKKYDSVKKTYNLINEGLTAAVDAKTKAPKVAFRDKRNTIQSNHTPTDKTLDVRTGSRYIGFNLQAPGKDYPLDFVNGKNAEGDDLYVKVDVDWSAMNAKNQNTLLTLSDSITPQGYQKLNSNGNYGGYVHMTFDDDTVLTPGSYKLKVSVGTIGDNCDFVPAAQSATITIKVAKDKALAFKPVTSYKISAKDNGYAVLTGKGSYDSVTFSNLQNDNVTGKDKGHENNFTTYFELGTDDSGNQILKLKDSCFVDGQLVDIKKEHLTGYVTYEAGYEYTTEVPTIKGTVKITVKLEDKTKYAVTNATADKAANAVANVTVSSNKKPVVIAYALVKEADKGTWQVVARNQQSAWAPSLAVNGSVISLQHTDAMTDKNAKVTLLVIPADSYYKTKIDNAADEEAKKAIITAYGVEIKTTITLNDLTDVRTNKRIAVDKANLTQKFTAEWEGRSGAESGYDATNDNYWIDVPYTELYDNATAQITGFETVEEKYQELIHFGKAEGEKAFSISMNKNAFMAKVAEKESDYYAVKTKDGNKSYTPKPITVNVKVYYGGTEQAPADPYDKIAFKLTVPAYPKVTASTDKTDFEVAVDRVKELEADISQSIADNMQKYNYYYLQTMSGEELDTKVKEHVKKHLEDHIRWYISDDSGIDMRGIQNQMTIGATENDYKAPGATTAGLVKVNVKFTNGKADDGKKEETVVFTVNLAPFGAAATDMQSVIGGFLDNAEITNKTTEASFLADLKAYVKEHAAYDTSKIRYTITVFEKTEATVGAAGSLAVKIEIFDIANGGKPVVVDKTGDGDKLTIPALLSADAVVTNVKKAVGVTAPESGNVADVIRELTKTNNADKTKKAVKDAADKAIGNNPYVVAFAKKEGSEDDDFTFNPASSTMVGSLSFKLVVKNEDNTPLEGSAGDVELSNAEVPVIAGLLTLTEAKAKVTAWITANTLGENEDASATSNTKVLKNGVTADAILNAIKTDSTNGVSDASLIAVDMKDDFVVTNATLNEAGSVKGTLVLTDMADATEEITLNAVIPALPQTEAQAVQIIKDAVDAAMVLGTLGITKDTQSEDETATNAILTTAQNAAGLKTGAFEITVKDGGTLQVTPPAGETAGSATITLVVKAVASSGAGTDCTIILSIEPDTTPETP